MRCGLFHAKKRDGIVHLRCKVNDAHAWVIAAKSMGKRHLGDEKGAEEFRGTYGDKKTNENRTAASNERMLHQQAPILEPSSLAQRQQLARNAGSKRPRQ